MIVIDNIKYACQKCIKGHRSSRCDHTERTLLIVKRKGRPISQCETCREKRQLRKVHQKCLCPKKYHHHHHTIHLNNSNNNTKENTSTTNNSGNSSSKKSALHIMSIEALLRPT